MKYVYGPVFSRRLGLSLGLDIIPYKTCSLDCLYCECGFTTDKTLERKSYVDLDELFNEIATAAKGKDFEYITFAGSGEPTLNKDIGLIIRHLKSHYPDKKIAVLTNGTLLYLPEVRQELFIADVVIPSVDAVSIGSFSQLNRPVDDLSLSTILEGIREFSFLFRGQLWVEVLFVKGINDTDDELNKMRDFLSSIHYDKIQINTVDRPPADSSIEAVSSAFLEKAAAILNGDEIKRKFQQSDDIMHFDDILDIVRRRPYTVNEIKRAIGLSNKQVFMEINHLEKKRFIERRNIDGKEFIVYIHGAS